MRIQGAQTNHLVKGKRGVIILHISFHLSTTLVRLPKLAPQACKRSNIDLYIYIYLISKMGISLRKLQIFEQQTKLSNSERKEPLTLQQFLLRIENPNTHKTEMKNTITKR